MTESQYNPLQWPPDLQLARLHYDCCKPGIDNPEGPRCPCCNRAEKLSNSKWPLRDITKDFKNYGGGIPAYFYLMKYLMVVFLIICGVKVVYHIMLLEQVCPTLVHTSQKCALVFGVFYFSDVSAIHSTLESQGNTGQSHTLIYLQLATYLILVAATIGVKVLLHILYNRTPLDEKLFSRFSLLIKNVPLYYQLEDLKTELKVIQPNLEIAQMFYLHKACECENSLKAMLALHFSMKNVESQLEQNKTQKKMTEYRKMKEQYLKLFDKYERQTANLKNSSKKVIVVFNTIEQKEKVHKALRMNEVSKFFYYFSKMLGCQKGSVSYYSERMAEPQEVYWKNIGQSSTNKVKTRIETTLVGLAFIAISFGLFYFPLLVIDEEKILDPGLGTGLGLLIAILIFAMAFIFRIVLISLMPKRRPSSKLAQGYFAVTAVAIYFFCFYLISPAFFYIFVDLNSNYKLSEFFMTVLIFCIANIILAIVDIGYIPYRQKKSLMINQAEANTFCQSKLHQQITPPPYPLGFKLNVCLNMWSFNSYYIFSVPQLVPIFFATVFILYWIDKYILYNRYKTQSYLSMELEHKIQKVFLVAFLFCVSMGYLTIAIYTWEKWLILGIFLVALCINFSLQFLFKKQKDEVTKKNTDLNGALQKCRSDLNATNLLNLLQTELKASFMIDPKDLQLQLSEASLATAIVLYGYQETYNLYLKQFQKKEVISLIQKRFYDIKKSHSFLDKKRQTELSDVMGKQQLKQKLLQAEKQEEENEGQAKEPAKQSEDKPKRKKKKGKKEQNLKADGSEKKEKLEENKEALQQEKKEEQLIKPDGENNVAPSKGQSQKGEKNQQKGANKVEKTQEPGGSPL